MTVLTKIAISMLFSVVSLWILQRPPAPTADERRPAPVTVWQGLEQPSPVPPTITADPPVTTLRTRPDACQTVFDTAKLVGWPKTELAQLVAVAYRESRCQPAAFNPRDPNGGSIGVMQINRFWCKPTRYWPTGYLQAHGLITGCDDLFDLETNLRAALQIYKYSGGWRAWSR